MNGTVEKLERRVREAKLAKHNQLDFFVADIVDAAPKSDRYSMEHPFFSLSKRPDLKVREYRHNNVAVTITPSVKGVATIWDKDVLIYCASQIVEAMNRGEKVSRTIRATGYDILTATQRGVGGASYDRLIAALERLVGTTIKTDIKTNGVRIREGFSLMESWRVVEKDEHDDRMAAIDIVLSEWFFNALTGAEVLTFNREYFLIKGGLERRLYELARKHCGSQAEWRVNLETLFKKSGSAGNLRQFRQRVQKIADKNQLPEYQVSYTREADQVTFRPWAGDA